MDSIAITFENMEDAASADIAGIIGPRKVEIKKTALLFNATDRELAKLSFFSQAFLRVARLLSYFEIDDSLEKAKKAILENISDLRLDKILKNKTFKVITKRNNDFREINSQEISSIIGEAVLKSADAKVKMKNYDIAFFAYIHGTTLYFGIDFSGFDLSKRHYKVFSNQTALNSSFAYLLFKKGLLSLKNKNQLTLLDPFCGIATIPIEAALFSSSKFSRLHSADDFLFRSFVKPKLAHSSKMSLKIYAFDSSVHNIRSAKKNAKIAGIADAIEFSNASIEWLDTRLGEKSVSIIATLLPVPGKSMAEKEAIKQYNELFYQAEYILADDSAIVAATIKPGIFAESIPESFRLHSEIVTYQGKQKFHVFVVKRA